MPSQCEYCGIEVSDQQTQTVGTALTNLDAARRQILADALGMPACPSALCASCFNAVLEQVNKQAMARQSTKTD